MENTFWSPEWSNYRSNYWSSTHLLHMCANLDFLSQIEPKYFKEAKF